MGARRFMRLVVENLSKEYRGELRRRRYSEFKIIERPTAVAIRSGELYRATLSRISEPHRRTMYRASLSTLKSVPCECRRLQHLHYYRVARHSRVIRRIGRVLARIARKRCVAHSPRESLLEPKSSGTDGSRRPQREVGSSECEVENAPELGGAFQYHRPYGNGTHGESSRRPLTL